MIRYAVRRLHLGWANMLALALSLAIAEECLIQQTSLAPMVLQLKGETYARALGVNYVYFLWALVYEAVFVVILPVHLVELMFPSRREELWVSKTGLVVTAVLFVLGSFLAWFSWTRIARSSVFRVPVYTPPLGAILIATAAIGVLIFLALGPYKHTRRVIRAAETSSALAARHRGSLVGRALVRARAAGVRHRPLVSSGGGDRRWVRPRCNCHLLAPPLVGRSPMASRPRVRGDLRHDAGVDAGRVHRVHRFGAGGPLFQDPRQPARRRPDDRPRANEALMWPEPSSWRARPVCYSEVEPVERPS